MQGIISHLLALTLTVILGATQPASASNALKNRQFSPPPNNKGQAVSLNFQDVKVRTVLQLLAEFTGTNIIVSDTVTGNITLRLHHLPWEQALDIILKARGLDKQQFGNVILVAPSKEIASQKPADLISQKNPKKMAPLMSELIQINYAKASNIATLLKSKTNTLLSKEGNVSVDLRTNSLWIQDTSKKIHTIKKLIKKLDIPVKQVLIEARIVAVNKNFEKDIGIRWDIRKVSNLKSKNSLQTGTAATAMSPLGQRLNVDLGAIPNTGTPGKLGIALAKLGNNVLLDLELSALESENKGEIISSPRVITTNQTAALIESGEEIPYQQTTSSGATAIAFKKAVLSLKVTPQITPDNKILLDVQVNQDTRGETIGNIPAINTNEVQTHVLVDNGQTIVLGGVYEQTKRHQINRLPFLGSLPGIGAFFRNNQDINNRKELLVFITPNIIQQTYSGY